MRSPNPHPLQNQNTQPIIPRPIFNNWDIVAKGWYIACSSKSLQKAQIKSLELCGQKIVVFRGTDGTARALDAYCPHLGTDLGIGRVDGNFIRCFFHHWAFDGAGNCRDIPCQSTIPEKARLQSYATDEKYGFIWVYPDAKAPETVAEFDELKGKPLMTIADKAFERQCHHHICMMNGIDAQHLRTVHQLNINMNLSLQQNQSGTQIDFTLSGEFPHSTRKERIVRRVLGEKYAYTMRYADGCIGLLTMMKNVKLFPPLHMIYAYTPVAPGRTRIQPIYVAAKRGGIFGILVTRILLELTRLFYLFLKGEDGKIYDNIRYHPNTLLDIDTPLVQYMNYVDRLSPSIWSKHWQSLEKIKASCNNKSH
ncbi:aromatic ring-hydroxylating dioxygenase subunit alpha [Phormidium sp. CCY1219]|uniref:aromatic ring-hydroxylating dioxygenase subunit alpha n=1 Tax=Phormidium sp. CCY1219 TaxID=2886104 RepID=UPI002D1EF71B|nr:aromatic ring-hydroxylating dioxygenase subunit alpha [Phormidium sp. CCY1219]MEB3831425.1 aromatic ring-hydroxylating dioxygenase subunit alpha [Phormidium sp. CCY1219]